MEHYYHFLQTKFYFLYTILQNVFQKPASIYWREELQYVLMVW